MRLADPRIGVRLAWFFRMVTVGCAPAWLLTACIVTERSAAIAPVCAPARCPQLLKCPPAPTVEVAPTPSTRPSLPPIKPTPGFVLRNTEVRTMHAELTGKDYELLIGLPASFNSEPERTYPLVLVLDGQWDFPLVNTLASGLVFDQAAPEMLIVGIAYGGQNPDYDELRADDYLPTRAKSQSGVMKGGGASRFLEWLEDAAIPMLEANYRAAPQHRVLAGTSFGGVFTLFALFEKPELFESYVALCPSVLWDERYLFRREQEFRKSHPRLERRLWLSSGGAEWPDYLAGELAFFRQVQNSRYAGLTLRTYQAVGERHAGLKPESFNRALRFISEPFVARSILNASQARPKH